MFSICSKRGSYPFFSGNAQNYPDHKEARAQRKPCHKNMAYGFIIQAEDKVHPLNYKDVSAADRPILKRIGWPELPTLEYSGENSYSEMMPINFS